MQIYIVMLVGTFLLASIIESTRDPRLGQEPVGSNVASLLSIVIAGYFFAIILGWLLHQVPGNAGLRIPATLIFVGAYALSKLRAPVARRMARYFA